jgi:hypothetical protein
MSNNDLGQLIILIEKTEKMNLAVVSGLTEYYNSENDESLLVTTGPIGLY